MSEPERYAHLSGQWVNVSSSWVRAVLWTAPDRLDVLIDKGRMLHYGGCPVALFGGLLEAGSKGTFLNTVIKNNCTHLGTT
ncbi:MAG TPA: KTSC domain-containing protein [Solirubrobacteraceae bacterium]